MIRKTKAISYPGIPIIFAEGFKNYEERVSYHNSAGLAITDPQEKVRTETAVELTSKSNTSFLVNDKPQAGKRADGMLRIVQKMTKLAGYEGGLKISSRNHNILSGSSDSGAAALVVALNDILELNLSPEELLGIGHLGSETVFRSLYGGLTEHSVDDELKAVQLADPDLKLSIFAVPFRYERFSADRLHLAVMKHPIYKKRAEIIGKKIENLKECLAAGNIPGVLKLMETDAKEVHRMFAQTGHDVIKPKMRKLCNFVEDLRKKKLNAYWNVAGGSCVYVFCPELEKERLKGELKDCAPIEYKIAKGASI